MRIETKRYVLREIEDADIAHVFAGLSNPQVIQYYGVSFDTLESTREQMEWFKESTQMWWAIVDKDHHVFMGAGGLNNISEENKTAEIGLWLLPEYWGMGIMKEVIPYICDYGFDTLGLNRIEGFVESENENCKKVMSKLNFTHEGTMQDCEMKNNKLISLDTYSLTKGN